MFNAHPLIKQRKGAAAITAAVFAAVLALAPSKSEAGLMLTLDDGINPVVSITDGGIGDASSDAGVVMYNGGLGSWSVNVTTGIGNDILGSPTWARIDLNSVNVSNGLGSLTISLTQTDISSPLGNMAYLMEIGGTTDGSVTYEAFADDTNAAFGSAIALGLLGPFGGGPFSGAAGGGVTLLSDYSITQSVTIEHDGFAQVTSFDAGLKIPEPGSLALLGFGLLLLGAMVRRQAAPLA